MTVRHILRDKKILSCIAPLDLELILSLATNRPREYLFAHPEQKLSLKELDKFNSFLIRRKKGEPIAYMTGKKEFYGLEFEVNRNVLIPRPETELLVEKALDLVPEVEPLTVIDVGTGSGNIIISVVENLPANIRKKIDFYATDVSKKALFKTKNNAQKHKVAQYIKFIRSDLLEYFLKKKTKFENLLIVANLPYVSASIYKKNIRNLRYEPELALISAEKGLGHYRRLLRQIAEIKSDYALRIICFAEISPEQKNGLAKIMKDELPEAKTNFVKDLSGRNRVVKIKINRASN
ncbi:MAG: HemK family modification methylase, methyltransferase [Candidatus Moranbacteria bacterium GW2011_GWC1_45_18]|nr:MAG: Release factor glutamine methyltransferase [Candidatus Moranbacteria bacterium GW2011_GWC2_40_12]KKT33367.1 MAG: Release factor glutamine methyltransferase [Candidatus Moranbacteria bacterium GW2011_GWF2_44_10]KKT71840.1 MAG: Release factor glutamine methyltransferase [Candidatus Moranbacteria bacterium GW2011_GWF1_44_4]KKT99934.1 MAG: HemK family modification methylase, methyltransferase [Candidatus Moranbacteria bacterium GW2011_GWC1_45_18]